jgi:N-methylhydantoinase A/oxoprolinase/acetone carboxylase beta subunit
MFMQSNGGLAEAGQFRGKDAILSGPAGGIVGMARMSQLAGFDRVIGFDMGGTSTDVSHFAGEYERVFTTQIAGIRLRAPMLDIHTVAAGGGSVLHFDGSRYRVGPDSAGADPGPACYRGGRPLAVTDANVMLGRSQPAHLPRVFGPDGDQPLDADLVRDRFADLAREIGERTGDERTPEQVAEGYLQIAVANVANAVKRISVQKGHDVTRYALTTFGGAGGQHAGRVAESLGIRTVLVPPMAGVLSALGIGLADTTAMREQPVEAPLEAAEMPGVLKTADDLESAARAELLAEDVSSGSGAPVVQTDMTNSRLTDPEVLEWRLPVRLDEFAVRQDSGGAGRWRGGDGAVRRIRFLEPMTVSTLSQHRRVPPYGMAGGAPGALGANRVERADGTVTDLGGSGAADVGPGDVLVIETPGGGGYGPPSSHPHQAGEETDDLRAF